MDPNDQNKEEQQRIYGDPAKIINYMDYQENPVQDNSRYVPELVPGVLQPLEINEIMEDPNTDEWLSKVDIEKIVKEVEESTKHIDPEVSKDFNYFASPIKLDTMQGFKTCMFSASTRKKANWAGHIFEQWKYITN